MADNGNGDKKKSKWVQIAQAIAIIIGALGTATVAVYGAIKPTGEEARVVHEATSEDIKALQAHMKTSRYSLKRVERQVHKATAEVEAVKTYVAGYLMGLQAGSRTKKSGEETKALRAIINGMAAKLEKRDKVRATSGAAQRPLPPLKKPQSFNSLIKKGGN